MKDLFLNVKKIASFSEIKEAIFCISFGKDSICMLDLCQKYLNHIDFTYIFFYIYKDLSIRNEIINYYQKKYKIKIEQLPLNDNCYKYNKRIKRLRFSDNLKYIREKYQKLWIFLGYKKNDSLSRRGMLSLCDYGVDWKYKYCYPLAEFTEKEAMYYIKTKKLKLPIDYEYGFRDVNIFKGEFLLWLYNNFRNDYLTIKKNYPDIEGELIRAKEGFRIYA